MPRLMVLLPCLNEEQALPKLLSRLAEVAQTLAPEWKLEVLVIDDGSTDATASVAERLYDGLPVEVVSHERNKGLGAALDTGISEFLWETSAKSDTDAVLTVMDADGTHPPELLSELLARLEQGGLDIVIASRFATGGREFGLPPLRRLYSRLAGLAMHVVARLPGVRDYSCGYRVYRRAILQRGREEYGEQLVTERGFVCMVELLVKLGRLGARIGEVGLELHYELKVGPSKMNVAVTIRRYAAFTMRVLVSRDLR